MSILFAQNIIRYQPILYLTQPELTKKVNSGFLFFAN